MLHIIGCNIFNIETIFLIIKEFYSIYKTYIFSSCDFLMSLVFDKKDRFTRQIRDCAYKIYFYKY